jgi:hypothetical protein
MTSFLTNSAISDYATSLVAGAMQEYDQTDYSTLPSPAAGLAQCCGSKRLFCDQCSLNVCFRMGPGCPEVAAVAGDLELVDRVAAGLKPLACVVLTGKSEADTLELETRLLSSGLPHWSYTNDSGISQVALCRDVDICSLVNLPNLARVYENVGLAQVAQDIMGVLVTATVRLAQGEPGLPLVSLLEGEFMELERQKRYWLIGLVYGYPVWSTIALMLNMRGEDEGGGGGDSGGGEDGDCQECRHEAEQQAPAAPSFSGLVFDLGGM